MAVVESLQAQIEDLDRKIVSLVGERRRLCTGLREETDKKESLDETVGFWIEEGVNNNLDEGGSERLARTVIMLSWKEED